MMSMFIETASGRLQNLYLLQDVRVVDNDEVEEKTYSVGYVQSNGVIIKEGTFSTYSEAETKVNEIKSSLVGGK